MPDPALPTTRRAALGGLLGGMLGLAGLAGVSGCDVDDLRPPEDGPAPPSPPEPGEPDPDQVLVETMSAEIVHALAVVAVARRFPRLEPIAKRLARTHRAHLRVLAAEVEEPTAVREPTSAGAALTQVRAEEERLQRTLASAAVDAQSGALARLLASMSAAGAQHLATLPQALDETGGSR